MTDTWPVNNGAVGQQGSTNRLSSRLDNKSATPTSQPSADPLDAFGGAGAPVGSTTPAPVAPNNDKSAKTYSGTTPAPKENFLTARTSIEDLLQGIVQQTADSFLQGLPGSLSSIIGGAVQGLLGRSTVGLRMRTSSTKPWETARLLTRKGCKSMIEYIKRP